MVRRVRVIMVFPGHILMLKILVQHLHTPKLAGETILSVREWYRDNFAVVEAHDIPGMVPMMKSTNDGSVGPTRSRSAYKYALDTVSYT